MLQTNFISTSNLNSQVCIDSFTGTQTGGNSWCGMSAVAGKPEQSERSAVSATMYPMEKLRREINHKDNQGGAHSV